MTQRDTRVLLADAPGAGRRAIAALLLSLPGITLVSEAGSLEELSLERRRTAPDVIVIDDRLLGAAGLGPRDAVAVRAERSTATEVLRGDPSFARRARRIGATAWIAKEHADDLLPGALADARRGATPGDRRPDGAGKPQPCDTESPMHGGDRRPSIEP